MKQPIEVVKPQTPLALAARLIVGRRIPLLAVCDGARLVGLLTARDLTVRATAQGCDPQVSRVQEVMTLPAIYGREDLDVLEAARLMQRWQLRGLPVLDRQGNLAGVVFLRDVLRRAVDDQWVRRKTSKGRRTRSARARSKAN